MAMSERDESDYGAICDLLVQYERDAGTMTSFDKTGVQILKEILRERDEFKLELDLIRAREKKAKEK